MRAFARTLSGSALLAAVLAGTVAAQGTTGVSGQVTILERPGEVTEDLGNVIVFLEPIGAATRPKPPAPTNTVVTLKNRQFVPRVLAAPEGSKIDFTNKDPFNHNVF